MLGARERHAAHPGLHEGHLEDALAARRDVRRGEHRADALAHRLDEQFAHLFRRDVAFSQHGEGHSAAFGEQAEQQMLAADIGVPEH